MEALYRTVWRWHFYAGLFVMPMVLILALSGSLYLFKPQVERWEERAWRGLSTGSPAAPSVQRDAALAAYPGAVLHSYRLSERPGDAVMIHLALAGGKGMRDVFVSPQGKVLGALNPDERVMAVVRKVHGQLLLGRRGSWIVELAASWTIVMIVTGLYLWWPRRGTLAGVVWPRLRSGGRLFWRDLHAVTGFWVAGLALVLLATGLPWASVWGSGLDLVRGEMGWVKGRKAWTTGGEPVPSQMVHDHAMMASGQMHMDSSVPLEAIVAEAESEHLAFPVLVSPPGTSGPFGGPPDPAWVVRSDAQNRPLDVTIRYSAENGREVSRETFAQKHPIDQFIGYGIAWHEGQLLGPVNQLIGLATALALVILSISGFVMWRRRRPSGSLGAPSATPVRIHGPGIRLAFAALVLLLPLFALSVLALWSFDRLALQRMPVLAGWLGMKPSGAAEA